MTKRSYERKPSEPNGRGKWQKTAPIASSPRNQLKALPGATVLRMLCPSSKFRSIIGKGGCIVSKIREETGAKVRIEDAVAGCDERVVVIVGSEKEAEVNKEERGEDQEETGSAEAGEDSKISGEDDAKKENPPALEGSKTEKSMPSAQKALVLVYERLVEGDPEGGGGDEENKKSSSVSVRLLIASSQIGCILGKGGSKVKQMSSDSGAHIRLLFNDKLPLCASNGDEIIQITGVVDSVRKALQSVSQQLLENPPRDRDSFPASNHSGPSSHPFPLFSQPEVVPPPNFLLHAQGPPFPNRPFDPPDFHSTIPPPFSKFHEGATPGQLQVAPEPIIYRLLCANDKVGSVIGKGGNIIRALKLETGCEIKILETAPESEDRIITISGPALPGDMISPAQDAVLRVQERIFLAAPDNKESTVLSRLLVSSKQAGYLIGKAGSIIADMRKISGANIRILGKDQVPKSVGENDEVVQVNGEYQAVQEALIQITTRLRHHLFRENVPPMSHTAHPPIDQRSPFGPFAGRREPSPPRLYASLPPFPNDSVGRPNEERYAFPPHHALERMPPAPWASQGMIEGGGHITLPDFPGAQRRPGGFPGGNPPTLISYTTVDVVVPRALVPSIYGEEGFCLRRIREISEAKITITEPRPEATETVILISGTPEQTHAAQSLLQAFVLSESGAP